MKYKCLAIVALIAGQRADAQVDSVPHRGEKVYKVNVKYELPAAAAGLALFSAVGMPAVVKHATISEAEVLKLNPADVNGFDRPVIFNPASRYSNAVGRSDMLLNITLLSPAFLAFDKKVRKDWLDLLSMYMVTHAVNNTIFLAAVSTTHRVRPLVYNPDVPMEEKTSKGKTNSFYSGHVSNTAATTFFIVKVLTDYHHIKGWKRILLYGAAMVPPAVVGHYRLQAGRHFRTDVITGMLIGATSGILVPEFHRIGRRHKLTMQPYYSPVSSGLSFSLRLNQP